MANYGAGFFDGALVRSVEEITMHPRFPAAVDVLIDNLANLYGQDRRLIRSLYTYNQSVTFCIAVSLALSQDASQPVSGFSVRDLVDAVAQMGIGPELRVRRIIAGFRADGLLDAIPNPKDGRQLRLIPSARMLEIDREWIMVFHSHLALLYPGEPRYALALAHDAGYQRRFRRTGLRFLSRSMSVVRNSPDIDLFLHQTSGPRLLAVLLQTARDSSDSWTPPGFYSIAAERCATTRVHIRTALRIAADAGLVEIDQNRDLRVRPTLRLLEAFARWTADTASSTDFTSVLSGQEE